MVDIAKQVAYWREGAEDALGAARDLAEKHRWGFCLFLAHLALEKLLKAFVCRDTQDVAPRVHSLRHLSELTTLSLSPEQTALLAKITEFNIEGRYPDQALPPVGEELARDRLERAEELYRWLEQRL